MNIIKTITLKSAGSFAIAWRTLFDICFNIFGKIILNLLFQVYNAFIVFQCFLYRNALILRVLRTSFETDSLSDEDLLKARVLTFKKVPQHMTLILGGEIPAYDDLVKIIKWSASIGIPHISFYDHHNALNSEVLFDYVCKRERQQIPLIKWGKSFSEDVKMSSKQQINGYSWRPVVTVHIFKKEEWSDEILNCFSELKSNSCDVSVKLLEAVLRKKFSAPDPDLAVVCGKILSLFGFPCWHLRITQILRIPSHHNISLNAFLDTLQEYCKSEQRYGK